MLDERVACAASGSRRANRRAQRRAARRGPAGSSRRGRAAVRAAARARRPRRRLAAPGCSGATTIYFAPAESNRHVS